MKGPQPGMKSGIRSGRGRQLCAGRKPCPGMPEASFRASGQGRPSSQNPREQGRIKKHRGSSGDRQGLVTPECWQSKEGKGCVMRPSAIELSGGASSEGTWEWPPPNHPQTHTHTQHSNRGAILERPKVRRKRPNRKIQLPNGKSGLEHLKELWQPTPPKLSSMKSWKEIGCDAWLCPLLAV